MINFLKLTPESARRMWERHYDEHSMASTRYRHGLLTMEKLDQFISDLEKGGDAQMLGDPPGTTRGLTRPERTSPSRGE